MSIEFRDITGYPGYRVCSDGTIWSAWAQKTRRKPNGQIARKIDYISNTWKMLSPSRNDGGYLSLYLCKNGVKTKHRVAILMLSVFVGNRPHGMVACHNNGIRDDNRIVNLRWDTPASNYADMHKHGTVARGERQGNSKLTEQQVVEIRERRRRGEPRAAVASSYGISDAHVKAITSRRAWRHVQ